MKVRVSILNVKFVVSAVRTLITSDLEGQSSESLRWTALKARFDPETFGLDAALSKVVL